MNTPLERHVYEKLLERIRTGFYKLGDKLPSETALAIEYDVSRPVLRTALARLRDDGLVVSRQGAGSFISGGNPTDDSGYSPLQGVEDISSYLAFRKHIEAEAAALAAHNMSASSIAELRKILNQMDEVIDTGVKTVDLDTRFHFSLAELSDNRFLVETLNMLRPHMYFVGNFLRSLGSSGYRKGKKSMNTEHHRILDAIEAKDPDAARQAMIDHFDASERRIFKGE